MTPLSNRTGPFWDGVHGRTPMPPAAATLGLQFIDIDPEKGTIELAFEATKDFINPMGNVLGAYLAAMLYDTVGPALLATLEADQFQSTLDINVRFLRPVRPARIVGQGRARASCRRYRFPRGVAARCEQRHDCRCDRDCPVIPLASASDAV